MEDVEAQPIVRPLFDQDALVVETIRGFRIPFHLEFEIRIRGVLHDTNRFVDAACAPRVMGSAGGKLEPKGFPVAGF